MKQAKSSKTQLFTKLCCVFFLFAHGATQAQINNDIRTKTVTIGFTNEPLEEALFTLGRTAGFQLVFPELAEGVKTVSLPRAERTVEATLRLLLEGSDLDFQILGNSIVLSVRRESSPVAIAAPAVSPPAIQAQPQQVTGRVISGATRETLPFVTIAIRGTTTGTITSINGDFTIEVPSAETVLVFSILGYEPLELPVVVGRRMDVRMYAAAEMLEAVVITGYQTFRPHEVAGSTFTLDLENIILSGVSSIDAMLQGAVPGMSVAMTSGEPGEAAQIRIRGNATLSSNAAPLWVVDGVIIEQAVPFDASEINSADAPYLIGNAISGLNPQDIESITILRDASATAIYGVRAANGVIVITTRRGSPGPARVEYSGSLTFRQRPSFRNFDRMNSQQRVQLSREIVESRIGYERVPIGHTFEGAWQLLMTKQITQAEFEQMVSEMQIRNTDWFQELFTADISQSHRLAVSGGTEDVRYFFSAGYNDERGGAIGSQSERFNFMGRFDAGLSRWLDVSGTLRYSTSTNTGYRPGVNPFNYAFNTARTLPLFNEDGSYYRYINASAIEQPRHPIRHNILEEISNTGNIATVDRFESLISLTARPGIRGLEYRGTFSYSISNSTRRTWATERSNAVANLRGYDYGIFDEMWPEFHLSALPIGGVLLLNNTNAINWTIRNALEYRETFNRIHSITAFVAFEARSNRFTGESVTGYGWNPQWGEVFMPVYTERFIERFVQTGALNPTITNRVANVASFMGTFSYSFQGRYVFNASLRSDGSNKFGSDPRYRWLPTWMVSGRWNISGENFIRNNVSWIDLLSLRASYGLQGNIHDDMTPNLITRIHPTTPRDPRSQLERHEIFRLPNPELRWERTSSWNVALDFTLFRGRLRGGVDVYGRFTEDLIMHRAVPSHTGRPLLLFNVGEMVNRGVDGFLQYTFVDNRNWMFSLGVNFGRNINEILLGEADAFSDSEVLDRLLSGMHVVEGLPAGAMHSFQFAGLSSENGHALFYAADGRRVHLGEEDHMRLVYSGSIFPTLYGGFDINTSFRRRFHLTLGFTYNIGNVKRLPGIYGDMPLAGAAFNPMRNVSVRHLYGWRQPGDEQHTSIPAFFDRELMDRLAHTDLAARGVVARTDMPIRRPTYFYDLSDIRVARADFLKLRSIRLSYDLTGDFTRRLGISSLRINMQILNVFTIADRAWEGVDPESANARIPNLPTYTFGVTLSI